MNGLPPPIDGTYEDDFYALRRLARKGAVEADTRDVYGDIRPAAAEPAFADAQGTRCVSHSRVSVSDRRLPKLNVQAHFRCSIMDVCIEGDTRGALAISSELQWRTTDDVQEGTRTNYIIRLGGSLPGDFTVTTYWWQLGDPYIGTTFAQRLDDEYRKAYRQLVIKDLLKSDNPLFGMLSPRPPAIPNPDMLRVMLVHFASSDS